MMLKSSTFRSSERGRICGVHASINISSLRDEEDQLLRKRGIFLTKGNHGDNGPISLNFPIAETRLVPMPSQVTGLAQYTSDFHFPEPLRRSG